jgi:glycolate oxidase iron-sulfur subunit
VYLVTGRESHSPRGKLHLIENLPPEQRTGLFAETISLCLLCGACRARCPRSIDTPAAIIRGRAALSSLSGQSFLKYLGRKALSNPVLMKCLTSAGNTAGKLLSGLPEESGLRLRLAPFEPGTVTLPAQSFQQTVDSREIISGTLKKGDQPALSYFTGCLANNLFPGVASATAELTGKVTDGPLFIPADQQCCGLPALAAGNIAEARLRAKNNIDAFSDTDSMVLTSCASCYAHLKKLPELFDDDPAWKEKAEKFSSRVVEFFTFFEKTFSAKRVQFTNRKEEQDIFYHDPCHLRFAHKITGEPRRLLSSIQGIRLKELQDGPRCCGQGGLFHIAHPDISQKIRRPLLDEINNLGVQIVVTSCSGCLLQWRDGVRADKMDIKVMHPAEFLLDNLVKS